ncbi:hypothetical protein RESH_01644 [Rhodopirellula europaea SH398]|uniref:Uncharacterized protein n=2 Tax=Rhodopirellula europaea TaxID=1263866 RepID=M2A3U8_9BACT|nr:hypothetical protein RE6C_05318 [Rhodopirellula europaea 6C]EMI27788.1 hypothetical protein RESH_01644 [Rhodopirellula europaea SH398]
MAATIAHAANKRTAVIRRPGCKRDVTHKSDARRFFVKVQDISYFLRRTLDD